MVTIPHRELRNNSSEILRRVSEGESFEITNNGVVVAELHAPAAKHPLAGRRFRAAIRRGGFADIPLVSSPLSSREIMDQLKGDS